MTAVNSTAIALASGEVIPAQTIVWCAGMRASPLMATLPGTHDRLGRIATDEFMRVKGVATYSPRAMRLPPWWTARTRRSCHANLRARWAASPGTTSWPTSMPDR